MSSSISGTSIAIQSLEIAAGAVEGGDASGLSLLTDTGGTPLAIDTATGCTASAYRDASGDVIIAYQGTSNTAQLALDQALVSGEPVSGLAGFNDALAFANQVVAAAAVIGVDRSHVFVTGHSLGGTQAEYVASQTGLAGAGFAGSGLGGFDDATPSANFVSFVDLGDPFGNDATDAGEAPYVQQATAQMAHVGTIDWLGGAADFDTLMRFNAAATALGISVTNDPLATLGASGPAFTDAWAEHALSNYVTQIDSRYGDVTLAQIAASMSSQPAFVTDGSGTTITVEDQPGAVAVLDLPTDGIDRVVYGGNAALDLAAGNTTVVLNGPQQNGAVDIDSQGGNTIWVGNAPVFYTASGQSSFILGDGGGLSGSVSVQGGDAASSDVFMVWGDPSLTQTITTDGVTPSTVFGGASNLDFNGGDATLILNGQGQTGSVHIDSQGGNVVWAGTASLDLQEGAGTDTILLDGAGSTLIQGSNSNQAGTTNVESVAESGCLVDVGGAKAQQLDLGGGDNTVFGGAAGQTIDYANASGTLVIADAATALGTQTIVAGGSRFAFWGGGGDAAITLGDNQAFVQAGTGNVSLTGGAGDAYLDLSQAAHVDLMLDGAHSGSIDIVGYRPQVAALQLVDMLGATTMGGAVVVTLADHATVTFQGITDPNQLGLS